VRGGVESWWVYSRRNIFRWGGVLYLAKKNAVVLVGGLKRTAEKSVVTRVVVRQLGKARQPGKGVAAGEWAWGVIGSGVNFGGVGRVLDMENGKLGVTGFKLAVWGVTTGPALMGNLFPTDPRVQKGIYIFSKIPRIPS